MSQSPELQPQIGPRAVSGSNEEYAELRATLARVALSSCRSAAGAVVGGEGVMSLTRAFFAAGAAVVVGSLWPLRDDDAESFFAVFYDHLAAGETAATAFSAAQRERVRAGAPAQAWAGFVLSGNGQWRLPPAPRRAPRSPGLLRLVGGLLLALLTGYLLRRRLRAKAAASPRWNRRSRAGLRSAVSDPRDR
ncbi:MAG TPA: CHAT domain-containing protein [Thermoanaerobaculia bacterium]|nr:CHAT domain-containing protein [Thermoanaerobaculia bacterium]